MWYEVLHAVNAVYCGGATGETALEEREVGGLANGLLRVLRDNPAFADYLLNRDAGVKGGPGHMNSTGPEPEPAPDHCNDH